MSKTKLAKEAYKLEVLEVLVVVLLGVPDVELGEVEVGEDVEVGVDEVGFDEVGFDEVGLGAPPPLFDAPRAYTNEGQSSIKFETPVCPEGHTKVVVTNAEPLDVS